MVDRLNFFNSISGINYPEMIVHFFDHFIALKQLVEDRGEVAVGESTDNMISFNVKFSNPKYKDQAINIVQSGPVVVYGRNIVVNVNVISEVEIKFVLQ